MPAVVYTEDYIERHTLVAGLTAHLFVLPEPLTRYTAEQDGSPFKAMKTTEAFNEHATLAGLARNRWVLIEFFDMSRGDDLFNLLKKQGCDIIGIGHVGVGLIDVAEMPAAQKATAQMTAICRRSPTKKLMLPDMLTVSEVLTVNTNLGGSHSKAAEVIIQAVKAWVSRCSLTRCNFELKNTGDTNLPERSYGVQGSFCHRARYRVR